jgi:hypothetical protein
MKICRLLYLLPLFFCCCTKPESHPVVMPVEPFVFTARYDSVITCTPNSTFIFSFYITVSSGDITANKLHCTISGLPSNVSVNPTDLLVAQLLGGVFTFNIGAVPPGTYPLKFTINSAKYGNQVHTLLLKVVLPPDNAPKLSGNYTGSYDYCQPAGILYNYSSVVTVDSAYRIKITNIKNMGGSFIVKAIVSDVISIPVQTVGGITIWGSGTFSHDDRPGFASLYKIIINDTIVHGSDTERCGIHILH